MSKNFQEYVEVTKGKKPRNLLVMAMYFAKQREVALELGAGALGDATYLLQEGFGKVIAVDKELYAADIAVSLPSDRFTYIKSQLDTFDFEPEAYDLVNFQYSLPFSPPATFDTMFGRLLASVKPGGVLVGQLFGERDSWNDDADMTFHSRRRAFAYFDERFQVPCFQEIEEDGRTSLGVPKHWHYFDIIASRK